LQEILGETKPAPLVKSVRVRNVKTGTEQELPTDGVFIAIGHSPNTQLFKGKLAMDGESYILTKPDSTATDVDGVWAAGDVQDKICRQAVTAAGTGCMAALEAEKWLARQEARLAQAADETAAPLEGTSWIGPSCGSFRPWRMPAASRMRAMR